ncbi:hypothetical protein WA026_004116 [Henosepilachna vigintioctopunctata]|uniref:DUF4485 domain-containing protein n=1 Tax=Henosepilachna vigintioctopunctata TaxID=420089 RepID=A0AAW1UE38_9CUCU
MEEEELSPVKEEPSNEGRPDKPPQPDFDVTDEQDVEVNKTQGLNENFFYNSMLARALLQILSCRDRKSVRLWLNKLADMDSNEEDIALRHEYMWFLLLMLETKKIREPFDAMPPKDLVPLRDAVPRNVYEEVLLLSDQTTLPIEPKAPSKTDTFKQTPAKSSPPAKFLHNQPWPKDGVICYLAAFSDRDY